MVVTCKKCETCYDNQKYHICPRCQQEYDYDSFLNKYLADNKKTSFNLLIEQVDNIL